MDLEINDYFLKYLSKIDIISNSNEIELIEDNYEKINKTDGSNLICLAKFIDSYIERGKRVVKGRDLYINHGDTKVISSTTTGSMGYFNKSNYLLKNNDIIYTIDGVNAGYVILLPSQKIFFTDHAGIISLKDEYVKKYGKVANCLSINIDLDKLQVLSSLDLDKYIYK